MAPAIVDAFNEIEFPEHTGEFDDKAGDDGFDFTTTCIIAGELLQPLTVALTE